MKYVIIALILLYSQLIQNKKLAGDQNFRRQEEIIHISVNPNNFFSVEMKIAARNIPFTTSLSNEKPKEIVIEPLYNGSKQLYGILKLGNRKSNFFPFVFDIFDSEEMHLYFDSNRNGNLTDDGKLKNTGTGRFATSIKIPWKILIEDCPYSGNFVIWFYTNAAGWNRGQLFSHYSRTQFEGTVYIKGISYKAYLVDSAYNDADISNDGICIDVNRNGKIEDDEMYLKYIVINGNKYAFEIKW